MTFDHRLLAVAAAVLAAAGCAHSAKGDDGDDGGTTCTGVCDSDGDGVPDGMDHCADTPAGQPVNHDGCADSQLTPHPELMFPPFGLTWTATGDAGRAGPGLTWAYSGIQRGELFHIYWIVCDDPMPPCAVSLDGPIDAPSETFVFSATDSDLPGGRLVFTNTTQIQPEVGTAMSVTGRLTLVITDGNDAALPFAGVTQLGVRPRRGLYGAEIPGTAFNVKMTIDARDSMSTGWTPYLDYYDAAHVMMGQTTSVSVGATFYDK